MFSFGKQTRVNLKTPIAHQLLQTWPAEGSDEQQFSDKIITILEAVM
jgi:hypothetical protein